MRRALTLVAYFTAGTAALAPLYQTAAPIEGQYIVKFSNNASDAAIQSHLAKVNTFFVYDMPGFQGYAAKLNPGQLDAVRSDESIEFVEVDGVAKLACVNQQNAEWGLDRVAKANPASMNGAYNYDETTAGAGIDAYIIDTGIRTTHTEFSGGRAIWGTNTVDSTNSDCNGHGTHVAGTVGGRTYGVAKRVTVIAVKVLNCQGSGSNSGVISGMNWVVNSQKSRRRPSVANMSLGGGYSAATNNAANAVVDAGITLSVAAGNENSDACNTSPASATRVITVGATALQSSGGRQVDGRSYFSNFGACLHIFAPGSSIRSAWHTSDTATNTISGTSMAAPHVCGATAVLLSQQPSYTPRQILSSLQSSGGKNLVQLECTKSGCNQSPKIGRAHV